MLEAFAPLSAIVAMILEAVKAFLRPLARRNSFVKENYAGIVILTAFVFSTIASATLQLSVADEFAPRAGVPLWFDYLLTGALFAFGNAIAHNILDASRAIVEILRDLLALFAVRWSELEDEVGDAADAGQPSVG